MTYVCRRKFVTLAILVLPIAAGIICWFVVALEAPKLIQNGLRTPPPANVSPTLLASFPSRMRMILTGVFFGKTKFLLCNGLAQA